MSNAHPAITATECGPGGQGINQLSEVTYHQIQHGVQGEGRVPGEEGFPAKQSRCSEPASITPNIMIFPIIR